MKIVTSLLVFILLQTKCLSSPTPKGRESVFSYHATIDVRNSACNHGIARWVLSGKLRAQHFNSSLVMKLDDLKTGIFNGQRDNLTLANEKEIPEESEVLLEPFIINKDDDGQITLLVDPSEPLWSINMKRGIASNFDIDTDIKSAKFNKTEKSVHGECDVRYKKILPSKENEEIMHKIIDYQYCSKKPVLNFGNIIHKPAPGFEPLKMKTIKVYKIKENNGVLQIHNIDSISQFAYQSMPKAPSKQHVDQYQEFDLQEMKTIEETIDISKLTLKKDIIYEHEGRDYEKENYVYDINEVKEEFFSFFGEFMNKMNTLPLQNHDITETNHMEGMFQSVRKMSTENLKELEQEFIQQDKQTELYILWSLLPYIGSEKTVSFIANYNFNKEDLEVNEQILSKALMTFPTYISFSLEDKIESYKKLLEIDFYHNIPIANNAKLSFANIVANGYKKNFLSKDTAQKYVTMFKEKFLDNTDNYEDRMTYLLGLINMAELLSIDSMVEIITNKTENSNLRVLALTGFKNHLKDFPIKMFDTFWYIVQNSKESLNMKIKSLDLLLSMELTQEQFNIILDAHLGKNKNLYGHSIDMDEKHITNYFISTLRSMKNEPLYKLKSFAEDALKNNLFPDYTRYWTTGNYLVSYNDKEQNLGSFFQAQLIGDPKTNALDTVHFTYNHFAMSLDMGTYELYLKIKGIPESIYLKELSCMQQNTTSVPELLDIVQKLKLKINNLKVDAHIEFVVFIDGAAVYALYDDDIYDSKKFQNMLEYEISSFFMEVPIHIWYPIMDYKFIPSDLGTELSIMQDMQDIRMKKLSHTKTSITDIHYRSSWNFEQAVQSHNPVISAITRTYKYFGDDKSLKINSFNYTTLILNRNNDSLNWVWDKVMGTGVLNPQALREYCPKCKRINEIQIEHTQNKITDAEYLGMKFNYTVWKIQKDNPEKLAQEFLSTHLDNSATLPHTKSVLMLLHYANFLYYFKQELLKGNIRTIDFYDTPGNVSLNYKLEKKGHFTTCAVAYDFDVITHPFRNVEWLFTINSNNMEPDKSSLIWNGTISSKYVPRYKEHDTFNYKIIQNINFEFYPQNSSTIIANVNRDVSLPDMNPNKFSSEKPKPATSKISVKFGDIENPNVYELNENYTTTELQIRKAYEMKQYAECKKDAEGLEFIPPTISCLTVFAAVSEYTHYKVELENASDSKPVRLLDTFRFDKRLRVILPYNAIGFDMDLAYRLPDPTAVSYHDYDVLLGMKRKCMITPKQMKTFNEKIISFDEEKSAVLIECFNNSSLHGVTVDKLSDKNIAFKFLSYENTITATIHDNKLIVTLNGNEIHEDTIYEEYLEIHFLTDKVIYIIDDQLQIYYNTEYMYIKVQSMYSADICGYCNYLE